MIASVFSWLDASMAVALPDGLRLSVWAVASGALSMVLYGVTSPQHRLSELKQRTADLQQQLAGYDGDFAGAMALTRQNLVLSLQRLGWALGPSLVAGAPIILVLVGLADVYTGQQVLPLGPGWIRSWLTAFFAVTTISALGTKFALRIH